MKTDLKDLKPRIGDYLQRAGVEVDTAKRPPLLRCPSPDHTDEHPSARLYEDNVYCPVCAQSWDVMDVAGLLHGHTEFVDKLKDVKEALGIADDPPPRKKARSSAPVAIPVEQAREVFSKKELNRIGKMAGWGEAVQVWPYLNKDGQVVICDVRFQDGERKDVISFYYTGSNIKAKGCPRVIFNQDKLAQNPDLPVLIVEGCKSAKAAEALGEFIPTTWPGGSKKVKGVDWSPLKDRDVFIYPDDDRHTYPDGKTKPWHKQDGMVAALAILEELPQAKVVAPVKEARNIKPSGADIVEALEVMSPIALAEYILNGDPIKPPRTRPPAPSEIAKANDFPFKILGTTDTNRAFFLGRNDRLIDCGLTGIGKGHLLALAPKDWWIDTFGYKKRVSWDDPIDAMIQAAGAVDFDPDVIRGRGAWREADGAICYHDGFKTYGQPSADRLYLRKHRKRIGITDPQVDGDTTRELARVVEKMTFETLADVIRLLAWATLAPFAGALPWRPAILITGPSESGKSTIVDHLIRPISLPVVFSGGETTEPGIRQMIREDSAAVVVEELEGDTIKKASKREDIFSLMRQSTSDQAPIVAKGSQDQTGISFTMRSMFAFIAISPEVEHVADDNRIFRVNLTMPKNPWPPIRADLKKMITPQFCAGLRALTWAKLQDIMDGADRIVPVIQDVTGKSARFSLADGLLMSTWFTIWDQQYAALELEEIRPIVELIYSMQPLERQRDQTNEMLDRLLSERVQVQHPKPEIISLRECLIAGHCGRYSEADLSLIDQDHLKAVAARHGLVVTPEGHLAVATNHHEIMRITGRGRGYQRQLHRHPGLVDKDRPTRMAGKLRRCLVLKDVLEFFQAEEF